MVFVEAAINTVLIKTGVCCGRVCELSWHFFRCFWVHTQMPNRADTAEHPSGERRRCLEILFDSVCFKCVKSNQRDGLIKEDFIWASARVRR